MLTAARCVVHAAALQGFLGCRHFSQTNELLKQAGQEAIDWQID